MSGTDGTAKFVIRFALDTSDIINAGLALERLHGEIERVTAALKEMGAALQRLRATAEELGDKDA